MNAIPLNKWTEIKAVLACGCYARTNVYVSSEDMTARDILNRYGATFFNYDHDHDQEHARTCLAAAPPLPETPFWLDSIDFIQPVPE